ncbi:hypothetical protein PPS11_11351 [Pseudomonas putida S11]|nr:hypothetical protein PPS11_11351 [Pseudomonas putida S11]
MITSMSGVTAEEGAVERILRNAGLQGLLAKACLPLREGLQRLDFSAGVRRRAGQGHHRGGLGGGQRQGVGGGGRFLAQATSRMKLEAAISWRVFLAGEED